MTQPLPFNVSYFNKGKPFPDMYSQNPNSGHPKPDYYMLGF